MQHKTTLWLELRNVTLTEYIDSLTAVLHTKHTEVLFRIRREYFEERNRVLYELVDRRG